MMKDTPAVNSSRGNRVRGRRHMVHDRDCRKTQAPSKSRLNQAAPKKKAVATVHRGSSSRGKMTFLTKPVWFTMRLPLLLTLSEKRLKTARPQNMIKGKAARFSSRVSTPQRALKTMPKTKV